MTEQDQDLDREVDEELELEGKVLPRREVMSLVDLADGGCLYPVADPADPVEWTNPVEPRT